MGGMHDFIMCATNPFGHAGSLSGVPDRFDGESVVVEAKTINIITGTTGKTVYLLVLPTVGVNLYWYRSGVDMGNLSDMRKLMKYSEATVNSTEATMFYEQYRTMSLGVRLVPTSSVMKTQGMVTASLVRIPLTDIWERENDLKAVTRYRSFEDFEISVTALISEPDSVLLPLASGVTLVSKHASGDAWAFAPLGSSSVLAVGKYPDATTQVSADAMRITSESVQPVVGADDNAYAIFARVDGLDTDTTFVMEVVHCYEATPRSKKGIMRSLARPSALPEPQVLDRLAAVQRNLPVGGPGIGEGWVSAVRRAASGLDIASLSRGLAGMAISSLPMPGAGFVGGLVSGGSPLALPWR